MLKKFKFAEYVLLLPLGFPRRRLPTPLREEGARFCSCHNTLALPFSVIIMDWIFASLLRSNSTWPVMRSPPENVTFGFKALKLIVKFWKVSSNILKGDFLWMNSEIYVLSQIPVWLKKKMWQVKLTLMDLKTIRRGGYVRLYCAPARLAYKCSGNHTYN